MELVDAERIDQTLRNRIRACRLELGLSRPALAKRLETTPGNVYAYETGQVSLSATRLFEIARALNAPVSFFYGEGKVKKPVTIAGILKLPVSTEAALLKQIHELNGAYLRIDDEVVRARLQPHLRDLRNDRLAGKAPTRPTTAKIDR